MTFPPGFFITPESLAKKFGLSYRDLSMLIYPTTNKSYRSFVIPKKSGGERVIYAPRKNLKGIQQVLCKEFQTLYKPKHSCHGFIPHRSIVTNASRHVGKRFVFNIDLNDFFGFIHFGRVRNLFLKPPFNYLHPTATVLAQLCCHKGVLPQGAPTSPVISNMICWKMDAQLQQLAYKYNCDYSRYADDITFSFTTTKRRLPRSIVGFDEEGVAIAGKALERIIAENGFEINKEKVRLQSRGRRQEVTGIVVNEFLNLNRKFIRQTSSMIYALEKFGAKNAEKEYINNYRQKPLLPRQVSSTSKEDGEFFIDVVKGRVNYLQMVKGRGDPVYRKIAYRLTRALGKENPEFLRSKEELISDSVFIVHNNLDDTQGTAFLLEGIGLVTNEHVVEGIDHSNHELVEFFRDYEIENKRASTFMHAKKSSDLAIFLKNKMFDDIPPLRVGDDALLRVGDRVTVVGYPEYSEGDSAYVNTGKIVQCAVRFGIKFYLLDVPVIHGNSGGPVLNSNLEVIGIATRGSSSAEATKFNGFIPISTLIDEIQVPSFKGLREYSEIIDRRDDVSISEELLVLDDSFFCKACFEDKKVVSYVTETRALNTYNCKFCGKSYISSK